MPVEFDKCVGEVKAKGQGKNPYAICRASMGTNAQIIARRGRKKRKKS